MTFIGRSIKAKGLTCIIILIIAMQGIVFLMPAAGAISGTAIIPAYQVNPNLYRASIPVYLNDYTLKVALSVDSANVNVNAPTSLYATVTYANGTPAMGATITLSSTPSGIYFEKTSFKAVSTNTLVTKFQASTAGSYTVTASASLDGYTTGTDSKPVTVAVPATVTPPTPTPLIATPTAIISPTANNSTLAGGVDLGGLMGILPYVAIVVVLLLLVLIVLAYLWFKRSLKLEPKKANAPCDGKSAIPIRVSFANGFGMTRRAKADTEIALETTAGSIQNVVLPNGRDFVDATLVTSKEFGPVTVTGRYKGRSAQAKVNFTYGQASLALAALPDRIPADGSSKATVTIKIKDDSGSFISPLEDRAIELKATMGKIDPSARMPARTEEVPIVFTAGDQSGTAVITALSGALKGEVKLTLQGIPKRFCMHCGSSMSMEASKCPKCGLTPPSGVDTKPCSTCGAILPEAAGFCYKCGARQPETTKSPPSQDASTTKK